MAVNKVELADGTVLMDVTSNTVTSSSLLQGVTATAASGETVVGSLGTATQSSDGLMSAEDKAKLDGIVMAKWVNMGTISSLPVTKSLSGVTTDMICARMELGTPSAQTGDWTINTDTADSITISGTIRGSTTCKLLLVQAESGTAS